MSLSSPFLIWGQQMPSKLALIRHRRRPVAGGVIDSSTKSDRSIIMMVHWNGGTHVLSLGHDVEPASKTRSIWGWFIPTAATGTVIPNTTVSSRATSLIFFLPAPATWGNFIFTMAHHPTNTNCWYSHTTHKVR
uniref:(northern house mosquito) hypothetical protein n=1 Tax=Culex pipiens TaxID=7175 RepID=A0A8D8ASM2_CULPI